MTQRDTAVCYFTVVRMHDGGMVVTVSDYAGKWHSRTIDRNTAIGWHEMEVLHNLMANQIEGVSMLDLPF